MLTLPLEGVTSLLEIKETHHSLFYCRGEKDWAGRRHLTRMAPRSYIQKPVDSAYLALKEESKVLTYL